MSYVKKLRSQNYSFLEYIEAADYAKSIYQESISHLITSILYNEIL